MSNIIKFVKLDERAFVPEKKSTYAAAFDLYALEDVVLEPFSIFPIRTGLSMEIPEGYKGEIYSRSGLASNGIFVVNQPGKIDSDYRGEILVLLMYIPKDFRSYIIDILKDAYIIPFNDMTENPTHIIRAGDRIAQFEIQKVEPIEFEEVDSLSETERSDGGLGSTGL